MESDLKAKMKLGLVCAALSAGSVFSIYHFDRESRVVEALNQSLRLSRQVASQVKTLTQDRMSTEKGETTQNALHFAVERLNLGSGERSYRLHPMKIRVPLEKEFHEGELFNLDQKSKELDYVQILYPGSGDAVRIYVETASTWFLGASSQLKSDLYVFLFFQFLGTFMFLWVNQIRNRRSLVADRLPVEALEQVAEVQEARQIFKNSTLLFRNLLKQNLELKKDYENAKSVWMSSKEDISETRGKLNISIEFCETWLKRHSTNENRAISLILKQLRGFRNVLGKVDESSLDLEALDFSAVEFGMGEITDHLLYQRQFVEELDSVSTLAEKETFQDRLNPSSPFLDTH